MPIVLGASGQGQRRTKQLVKTLCSDHNRKLKSERNTIIRIIRATVSHVMVMCAKQIAIMRPVAHRHVSFRRLHHADSAFVAIEMFI